MIKRRDFIKNTLISGVGSSLAIPQILQAKNLADKVNETKNIHSGKSGQAKKIIVAGAGISGLCCGYELMKAGHDVTVMEASGRHGGHVFTGRDGLSDGLYADFGADHITRPGYEKFFDYISEFGLTAIPYPHAEGSEAAYDKDALKMIGGKFYSAEMLKDPAVLGKLGFHDREVQFLSQHPWHALSNFYLKSYQGKFTDPFHPFGV